MQYFNIADLNLAVDGADYEYFADMLSKYSVKKPDEIDAEVVFRLCNKISTGNLNPFSSNKGRYYFENGDYQGFYDYVDEIGKTLSMVRTDVNRKLITYDYCDLSDIFGIEPHTSVTNVMGNLFRSILLNHNGIVIHASAILYHGEVVTFTAPSGTGKSTHTGLWKKFYSDTVIINDDSPAIRLKDGRFFAYGTPWSGKSDINENISAPLRAMVFLERSNNCSIEPISTADAFVRLVRELPLPHFKHQSDMMINMLNRLLTGVPSYLLKCDISRSAVDTVKYKLFNDC